VLIVEVLSESTYETDMDLRTGKGISYARAGVDEYLVVDPEFEIIGEGIRGWQRQNDAYVPWLPEGDGRRHSRSVEASFDIEDGLAAVYAGDGERQLREGEVSRERAELRALRRQLDELQRQR
jgi:Uma2 family endonuclease